jgi:hypothetical protein
MTSQLTPDCRYVSGSPTVTATVAASGGGLYKYSSFCPL